MEANLKVKLEEAVDAAQQAAIDATHAIYLHPEPGDHETFAVSYLTDILRTAGFTIKENLAGLPTAFEADYGSGHPRIALLAEYDALPGYGPNKDQWGHACGHNWIAGNCLGTALAMKKLIDEKMISGTICFMGCPAEESTGGKVTMTEQGCFDDMDLAMQIHITNGNEAQVGGGALAFNGIEFTFHGVASHAAAAPEKGINALDACYLMFNGVNALRQHVPSDVKLHGIIVNGGAAPNIVPAEAASRWEIRAEKRSTVDALEKRFFDIAQGACLMTGATYSWRYFENKFDNCINFDSLDRLMVDAIHTSGYTNVKVSTDAGAGSTDVGNVSQVCPTVHVNMGVGNMDGYTCHEEPFLQYTDGKGAYEILRNAIYAQTYLSVEACTDAAVRQMLAEAKGQLKQDA